MFPTFARTLLTRVMVVWAVFTVIEVGRRTMDSTPVHRAEDLAEDRDADDQYLDRGRQHDQARAPDRDSTLDMQGTLKYVDSWSRDTRKGMYTPESVHTLRDVDTPGSRDTFRDVDTPGSRDTLDVDIPDSSNTLKDVDTPGSIDIHQGVDTPQSIDKLKDVNTPESSDVHQGVDIPESIGKPPNTPKMAKTAKRPRKRAKVRPVKKSPDTTKDTLGSLDTPKDTPGSPKDTPESRDKLKDTPHISEYNSEPESEQLVFKIKAPPPGPVAAAEGKIVKTQRMRLPPAGFLVTHSATLRQIQGNFGAWYQSQCDHGVIAPAAPPGGKQPVCDCLPKSLIGRQVAPGGNFTMIDAPSYVEMKAIHTEVQPGGTWSPKTCTARQKVAIIVPFRAREHHLRNLVHNLHGILQRQMLSYRIIVAEQVAGNVFNKGKMMNVGYREAMKLDAFDCVIFHDVDMMLENDYSMHTCQLEPTHLGAFLSKFAYRLKYSSLVGGALAMRPALFRKINGYSNLFQGWGGEDDDMYRRITKKGSSHIYRYPRNISMYSMILHSRDKGNPKNHGRVKILSHGVSVTDGLMDLKYSLVKLDHSDFFTRLLVDPDSQCSWANMDTSYGMGRGNSPVMQELSATSSECQDECVRQTRCRAVSWDSRHLKCFLHPEITTDIIAESLFEYYSKECVTDPVEKQHASNVAALKNL